MKRIVEFKGSVGEYVEDNGGTRYEIMHTVPNEHGVDLTTYDGDDFEYDLSKYKNQKVRVVIEALQ